MLKRPKIFLGYAFRTQTHVHQLAAILEKYFDIIDWHAPNTFVPSGDSLGSLLKQLDICDFAVLVLSEDDHLRQADDPNIHISVPRDNMIFESGLFIGRIGRSKTLIIKQGKAKLPTDLDGFTYLHIENIDDIKNIGLTIKSRIEDICKEPQTKVVDASSRIVSLALIRCNPFRQDDIVSGLRSRESSVSTKHGISHRAVGALYGSYDDFLLFDSPDYATTCKFIKEVRTMLGDPMKEIETRHLFPGMYYEDPNYVKYLPTHLVLASCLPNAVERSFERIVELTEIQTNSPYRITHAGITFGAQDIFFILSLHQNASYDEFVRHELKSYLGAALHFNLNSLSILREPNAKQKKK